ncbi:glutaminyl-peptide cyclotransferase [Kordiimonas sp. SCSIO 12610]|uniref:glutaminyl-peptide cyclotransferase n=1 Tax=Kordiimonas sp. SCSIO 12610 TaxID=2829597 RepID=UPI002109602F|nr:glutaminyl-peptide cyclotransferase [Kordiimonas sp. SCSIO 12610]UTW55585.1 glutaminyl-peptide cyclotransferase [Kordiimonas sp. SCSIO 12610]
MRMFVACIVFSLAVFLNFTGTLSAQDQIPRYGYKIINSFPHDPNAFTQGLLIENGVLYESTGLYGESSVRRVALETGQVEQKYNISRRYFGEGIVNWKDKLFVLSWRKQTGFVLGKNTFRVERQFHYRGEGWGITQNGEHLIMSDGTNKLRYLDPEKFNEVKEISVTFEGNPVQKINELEWVNGEIFANVWQSDLILRIDPETGAVKGILDLTGILPDGTVPDRRNNVLNGIAYDADTNRLFVTGKKWPTLFEIQIVEQ